MSFLKSLIVSSLAMLLCSTDNLNLEKQTPVLEDTRPHIVRYENKTDFDTGYFYQAVDQDGNVIDNEYYEDIDFNSSAISKSVQRIQAADPFEGDTFVPNKSFLTTYFSHLTDNIPLNRLGICGYTAASMLLSFYDSYWSDGFIEEKYDSNPSKIKSTILYSERTNAYKSPGVYNNITYDDPDINDLKNEIKTSGIIDESSTEFKEALDRKIMAQVYAQIDADTFIGKLFTIAINNGSIKPHFVENEYHVANEGYIDGIGVSYNIVTNVLTDYISGNENLSGKIKLVTSKVDNDKELEQKRIRSEIVEIVKSGRPVLMGGNGYTDKNNNGIKDEDESKFGHDVIAYDYDAENDILYGNMGWSSTAQSHRDLDKYFNIGFSDYWAFNISSDLPQTRTNNYILTDKTAYYSPGQELLYNIIKPADYGFPQSYGEATEEITKIVELPETKENITTIRQRCGYIEKECINISTKRYEPGIAFLEYTFDKDVERIDVELSWWGSKEWVQPTNSTYTIDYLLPSGEYETAVDLWTEKIRSDRTKPTTISAEFPKNIKTFRIYGQASIPENDRNKGRLSIFNMNVYYNC